MSYFVEPATTQPKIEHIGSEGAAVVVIDDFIEDPDALVDFAASHPFQPVTQNLYPGVRARAPEAYARGVVSRIEGMVRQTYGLSDSPLIGVQCDFSLVTTSLDKLQLLQALPHFDTTNLNQFAVLHYLCPAERGGTSFYRHRSTGFESVSGDRHDAYLAKLGAELKASGPPERAYIDGDTALFERIAKVDAAFNRLVIYRSACLHSGNIRRDFGFEQDVRKGRLTVNMFLLFGPRGRSSV
ncbi:MAG: DUF6445 family protein [Rhizomicrobium sp.]|nr:DUF6445 family protein [Rhizomicrobium sp.]